jgi:hypothetical protein
MSSVDRVPKKVGRNARIRALNPNQGKRQVSRISITQGTQARITNFEKRVSTLAKTHLSENSTLHGLATQIAYSMGQTSRYGIMGIEAVLTRLVAERKLKMPATKKKRN